MKQIFFYLTHKRKIISEYQHYHEQFDYLKQYYCCSLSLDSLSLDMYSQITLFKVILMSLYHQMGTGGFILSSLTLFIYLF